VGLIQDDHDRHEYFCNTAGFGLEGLICIQSRKLSHLQGYTMYLTATVQTILRDFKPIPMQITYDGGVIQRKLSMLTVTNGPRVGGGFRTTPAAIFDDGALDFLCANAVSRLRMAYLLTKLMRGTHTKDRAVQLGRTTHLNVQAEAPLAIHLDGEIFASPETNVRQADIKVIPGGIQLLR
jgi:diacylglycerol kinase (ATP)